MSSVVVVMAVLAASAPVTTPAAEVVVEPGQTVSLVDIYEERWPPPGTLVAEQTVPFEIDFRPAWESTLHGSLSNLVVRTDDGALKFGYRITASYGNDDTVSLELSGLKVRGFAGFRTGTARNEADQHLEVRRSADGAELEFRSTSIGNIDPPTVWVNTDATSFDAGGSTNLPSRSRRRRRRSWWPAARSWGGAGVAAYRSASRSAARTSVTLRLVDPWPMRPMRQALPLNAPRPPPISMP
jgi:hypothetical protein